MRKPRPLIRRAAAGGSEAGHNRCKCQLGQMDVAEVRVLQHRRQQNARLRKVLAEQDLEMSDKGIAGKKVIRPWARQQAAQAADVRGVRQ
jgi:hypothetical protein